MTQELEKAMKQLSKALEEEANAKHEMNVWEILIKTREAEVAIAARKEFDKKRYTVEQIKEIVSNNDNIYNIRLVAEKHKFEYDLAQNKVKVIQKTIELLSASVVE